MVRTLGILYETPSCLHEGQVHMHGSFGRVIDALASDLDTVILCGPMRSGAPDSRLDYCLQAGNLRIIRQPFYATMLGSLRHLAGIARAYFRLCRQSKRLFIRGMPPFSGVFYLLAWIMRCKTCHWVVGDAIGLLRSHRRAGRVKDALLLAYAWQDRIVTRIGRWLTGGAFICNGQALAQKYRSARTQAVVSSTITENDFFERADTCQGSVIRLLFVGFVRPEKGVEYLLDACSRLRLDRPWQLEIVGSWGGFEEYKARLDKLIETHGMGGSILWSGYVKLGSELFNRMRQSDALVLPTLSEGTPRVLVEARANSLPVIATNVGGIPSSVKDGFDGVLVPPADGPALACAIERVVADGQFRRELIRNGLASARELTLDAFIGRVRGIVAEDSQ